MTSSLFNYAALGGQPASSDFHFIIPTTLWSEPLDRHGPLELQVPVFGDVVAVESAVTLPPDVAVAPPQAVEVPDVDTAFVLVELVAVDVEPLWVVVEYDLDQLDPPEPHAFDALHFVPALLAVGTTSDTASTNIVPPAITNFLVMCLLLFTINLSYPIFNSLTILKLQSALNI
jgi:hypothetical protein